MRQERPATTTETISQLAGLTQEEVAVRLGRPQSFVAKYEGGERRIDVVEFVAVAQALEQDPRALFATLVQAVS
jgi:transcriptional regulator with XRE-family HTH domain